MENPPGVSGWRAYQDEVARLFRGLGCSAEADVSLQGTTASHLVDLWVGFKDLGLDERWVVECKDYQDSVPKGKVLALKALVEDVGADRGILVTQADLQADAIEAAQTGNVTLVMCEALAELVEADVLEIRAYRLEATLAGLLQRALNLSQRFQGPGGRTDLPGGMAMPYAAAVLDLITLKQALDTAKREAFPISLANGVAEDMGQFIAAVEPRVAEIGAWLRSVEAERPEAPLP
jgi:hypothetical protein